jgi:hypothetical protein
MPQLSIGCFGEEIVAALAYDLAARLMDLDRSELNFSDERVRELVPLYGEAILAGLDEGMPGELRAAIRRVVNMLAG